MRFLLLLLLVAIAMVAQAPAWLVAQPLRDASRGIVELRRPTGTIWRGAADVALKGAPPAAREAGAGRIEWSVRRFDPVKRTWAIEVRQSPPPPPAASSLPSLMLTAAGADRVEVSGSLRLPVDAVGLVPLLAGWTVGGDATADIRSLQWDGSGARGNVAVRWTAARIVPPDLPGGIALGDAEATVVLSGHARSIRVRNAGGDVDLALDASSQTRTVAIAIQPRPVATPKQLAWLQSHTMGRTPSGGFRIDTVWP